MWDKLNTAAHNSLCGYSQSKWSVLLHPRFPKVTPAFQRGYLPSSSTEPQSVWGWMADLKQSTGLPGYSLHSISTTSTLFLESTSSLMQWGNKSPEAEAAGSSWEQCRALLAPSHATMPAVHTCCSSSSGHFPWAGNLRMLFFQRGESSAGRWGGFPGAAWDTAHAAPCFTPRHKASTAVSPWLINQEPNYSNPLTHVPGAARSSSGTALCYKLLQHKA